MEEEDFVELADLLALFAAEDVDVEAELLLALCCCAAFFDAVVLKEELLVFDFTSDDVSVLLAAWLYDFDRLEVLLLAFVTSDV